MLRPFHQHGGELVGIDRLEQRDVLVDELFLERDRVRGDDDAFLVLHRVVDRRQQIGERFADAGAGFDEQMFPVGHRLSDRGRHLELLGAILVALAQPPRDGAVGAEDVVKSSSHPAAGLYPNECRIGAGKFSGCAGSTAKRFGVQSRTTHHQ